MNMAAASLDAAAISPYALKYDVFLSFRGEDTRNSFTSHLYAALCGKKIKTYIDDTLEKGDQIAPALLKAIEKSKLSAIIFSENYASSTWCLDEIVHILDCKKKNGQVVIPIFYNIDPSHIRKQQGSYEDAFVQHKERFKDSVEGVTKVCKWRDALKDAANLSGFVYSNKTGTEANFIEKVVEDILTKLKRISSSDLKGLIGIEKKIKQIELLLCIDSPDVCTVGIWGMGGIGKTTLADAVYHRLSSKFEASCFLANVREESEKHGLNYLRNVLIREILKEKDLDISTPTIGSTSVRERLSRTKALIVLDDVNASRQLELLLGDHVRFGPGSQIIITTRDKRLLKRSVDKIYEVKGLSWEESLELFHLHAFKNNSTESRCAELLGKVVDYAGGMPLALKILGSLFLHCDNSKDWEHQWNELKKFPNKEIENMLRLSYEGLERNAREIFLDIACFYKGTTIDSAKKMLDVRGFFEGGIKVLIDKSLISISKWNCLEMHDLVQEMGRAIVHEQCIEEPGRRSRLFDAEDIYHVLKNNSGTETVQAIIFKGSKVGQLHLDFADFKKMSNLRLLTVMNSSFGKYCKFKVSLPNPLRYLCWEEYPLKCLPVKFSPENLVEIRMGRCKVEQLWNKDQNLRNLKVMDLHHSDKLTKVPDLSQSRKIEHINLFGCRSLVKVPSSLQCLDKLTHLDLGECSSLKCLPDLPENIEYLDLSNTAIRDLPSSVWNNEKISYLNIQCCKYLENLPSNNCKMKLPLGFGLQGCLSLAKFWELPRNLVVLVMAGAKIETLPSSIERLFGLRKIELKNCNRLLSIPTSICELKSLEELDLTGCSKFKDFPEILKPMGYLKHLWLNGTAVKELPESVEHLFGLRRIELKNCNRFLSLPASIFKLKYLGDLNLTDSSKFEDFPEILEPMRNLKYLWLSGTAVKELPESIERLFGLRRIELQYCNRLLSLPSSIFKLKYLGELDLTSSSQFKDFPEILEPMGNLKYLWLNGTAVKDLPESIERLFGLRMIDLKNCNSLQSLPASIFKLKYLAELDLTGVSKFKDFPELLEPMGNLNYLCLNGTDIEELPESIERLFGLQRLELKNCNRLQSLPASIFKLKCLGELYLTGSSKFKHFPEILKPMGYLKSLWLNGTAVEELPESIDHLFGLRRIELKNCNGLLSLPGSICKLKYLGQLDLTGISKFKNFPEILEPMENLKYLCLYGTAVEELDESIERLFGLQRIELKNCNRLLSLPASIFKLKYLWQLDLIGCSKFEYFPEILEPMGNLKYLCLNGTAVKKLPESIERLFGLQRIELKNCNRLLSLPASIYKLKDLGQLDLTGCSKFKDFPEVLEPMENLDSIFWLNERAGGELPKKIKHRCGFRIGVELKNCKSLLTLPSSICKLKSLVKLDLTGSSKFEDFPEILEPMGNLKYLRLNGTAVKGLPKSIENLVGLLRIELKNCNMLMSPQRAFAS
ncbi:disease resistance protein RUN1-like [Malus sylvestris]|uniref:disease resistance protein RUN1-like n=1 Tax=Malus sylvestris TaxID=3752 RepID=UPI0021AD1585|nr:disease resistance protein RUN1-like [Malus sylvestris]